MKVWLRLAAMAIGLVLFWYLMMAGILLATQNTSSALVLGRSARLVHSLPGGISLLKSSAHTLTVTSDEPDYVWQLYKAGAWIVLPARKSGCISLR